MELTNKMTRYYAIVLVKALSFLLPRRLFPSFYERGVDPVSTASRVQCPALIVHGSMDQEIPANENLDPLSQAAKNLFTSIVVDGASHYSILQGSHKLLFQPNLEALLKQSLDPESARIKMQR